MSRDEKPRPAVMAAQQIDGMRGPFALHTNTLPALLSDCRQRLGFVGEQQVPGVWALGTHGSLAVQRQTLSWRGTSRISRIAP